MSDDTSKIEIYKRANKLKVKAGGDPKGGPGRFDATAVNRANIVIQKMSDMYPNEIKKSLEELDRLWGETKQMDSGARADHAALMSNTANKIKDLAGTFGYELMSYFGTSLRDYILDTDLSQPEQATIVQAHVDVMQVAYRENLKGMKHPLADELKRVVAEAIAKYS
ncbi:hypothetical protein [Micavibrio aeruginosavorus]|uniref:hypothetical protein n=1 Tax=Micavibrio aeruginosavorus TaxID=349221 RepID=UPI003F4A9307